jgi:drug/metabolite transporter (DMT)-like permease
VYRARSRGVGARVLPYVGSGIAAGLVFGIASAWAQQLNLGVYFPTGPVAVGLVPLISIGLALFVLARVERNWPLLAFATGYVVVALVACGIGVRGLGGVNVGAAFGKRLIRQVEETPAADPASEPS